MAESGELRAVALAGVDRLGPGVSGGYFAWAGLSGAHRYMLLGGLSVVQAELTAQVRDELEES